VSDLASVGARSSCLLQHSFERRPPERSGGRSVCRIAGRVGTIDASVLGAVGSHLFPSRTQQLSPPAPKILGTSVPGKIGQGRDQKRLRRASVEVVLLSWRS